MMKLNVLDQSPISEGSSPEEALHHTVALAQALEKMGYSRFWVSEHHDTAHLAGSSPEVLISYIAAKTSTIRVGSGGVMLPHYSAYKVAENFRVLEGLAPGRIDLGIGRAPGGMPIATYALNNGHPRNVHGYPEQIDDLLAYLHDALPDDHPYQGLKATPLVSSAPEIWILGSSSGSARIAAEKGLAFTFAQFINETGGPEAIRDYRQHFQPSKYLQKPHAMVAVFVICAESEEETENMAKRMDLALLFSERGMRTKGIPSLEAAINYAYTDFDRTRIRDNRQRMVVGTPDQVKATLLGMQEAFAADELMLVSLMPDLETKIRSYRLIANEMQLSFVEGDHE